ncbi:hypothetical protein ACA910_006280 [Epithemia clementina (nom. ined.)]
MSANFFAALDDSDEEAAVAAAAPAKQAVAKHETKEAKAPVKSEERYDQRKPQSAGGANHAGRHNANRNTKYGRGGPPPQREGKRQYDRRSGTGRGKEIKKDGGGAHNWGSDAIEARSNEGAIADEANPGAVDPTYEATEEEAGVTPEETEEPELQPEPEPEPEPEDNTLSYDEYMALKKEQGEIEALKPVKEREVENEFQNIQAKKAVKEDFLVMGGGKGKRVKKQKEKEAPEVELGFRAGGEGGSNYRGGGRGRGRGRGRFDDDREGGGRGRGRGRFDDDREGGGRGYYNRDHDDRDGGGRGYRGGGGGDDAEGRGRGRGRGRGGRGGGRFEGGRGGGRFDGRGRGRGGRGRGRSGEINVNDEHDFPSLS